jgi:hypothetical protein
LLSCCPTAIKLAAFHTKVHRHGAVPRLHSLEDPDGSHETLLQRCNLWPPARLLFLTPFHFLIRPDRQHPASVTRCRQHTPEAHAATAAFGHGRGRRKCRATVQNAQQQRQALPRREAPRVGCRHGTGTRRVRAGLWGVESDRSSSDDQHAPRLGAGGHHHPHVTAHSPRRGVFGRAPGTAHGVCARRRLALPPCARRRAGLARPETGARRWAHPAAAAQTAP